MIRNDPHPAVKPGYEPSEEGVYARCPDHGSRLWWLERRQTFICGAIEHDDESAVLAPEDVYLEHNEAWRVVNGCLYVDLYDEVS